jgi:hypothetical protein
MTGPLEADELAQLTTALRGGAMTSTRALLPYMNDGLRMWAVLREVLAADVANAEVVARAGLFLRASERGAFARELFDDVRPEVRAALLAAWTPADVSAPGQPLPTVPDAELDELLRRGLTDDSDAVRAAAARLAFAANRGGALVPELALNIEAADRSVRWWSTLALGGADDALSLELLRQEADVDHAGRVAAAVRALGARADGKQLWLRALEDARNEVRAAALHALATVVRGLDDEEVAELAADARADVQEALAAYQRRLVG